MFLRVRLRLALLNVAVMAAVIAALGAAITLLTDHVLMATTSSALVSRAQGAAHEARENDRGQFEVQHAGFASGVFYVLWAPNGTPTFDPAGATAGPLRDAALAAINGQASTRELDLPGDHDVVVASEPVHGSSTVGAVQVGQSLEALRAVEQQTIAIVAAASAGALAASVLAGFLLAGRSLVPIRQALERQREFTADASHELRTPLSALDTGIQILRRHPEQAVGENEELLASMQGEARRMGRLVANLLALARADSGEAELAAVDTDVDELVRTALREADAALSGGEPRVRLVEARAGTAAVDPDRLKQLLLILVDNALRYSPPGSPVDVTCVRRDHDLVLEVADRGPGIPAEVRERVFERFSRLGRDLAGPDAGAGLGLPIARWIATAHGGAIGLHDNGPGLRVRVVLPYIPSPKAGEVAAPAAAGGVRSGRSRLSIFRRPPTGS
jgi:two-component system, OmpR family, sensor histidine kinase CiaH